MANMEQATVSYSNFFMTNMSYVSATHMVTGLINQQPSGFLTPPEPSIIEETLWEPPLLENTRNKRRIDLDDEEI